MLKHIIRYNYISITTYSPYFSANFSQSYHLVDEGSFYRIADLHIIEKNNVVEVVVEEEKVVIRYKDGKAIELGK